MDFDRRVVVGHFTIGTRLCYQDLIGIFLNNNYGVDVKPLHFDGKVHGYEVEVYMEGVYDED